MTRVMERAVPRGAKMAGGAKRTGRRRVAILGATGSIGCGAIEVCRHLADRFEIRALTAVTSWKKLAEQALEVHPAIVALNDKSTNEAPSENLRALRDAILGTPIKLVTGPHAMEEIARRADVDIVVAAVVGAAGLAPVIAAARAGKVIALANKEALVVAGSIVMPAAR